MEVQPDTGFEDNGWPEAGVSLFNLDINAGGLPEQLLQEESSSAFDSIRAQVHTEHLECLPANFLMFQGRKEATEVQIARSRCSTRQPLYRVRQQGPLCTGASSVSVVGGLILQIQACSAQMGLLHLPAYFQPQANAAWLPARHRSPGVGFD